MALTKVKLIADGVITSANLDASHGITTSDIGEGSNLYYTDSRVSSYLSTNGFATQTDIVAAITDSAPVTLDTLNELAAALGDDPNFATTTATSLGLKAPLASPSFTGNVAIGTTTNISSPLTVQTDGSANSISIIGRNNGASDEAIISFYEYDGTTRNSYILKDGGNLIIATGTGGSPLERMRITSAGQVQVGYYNTARGGVNTTFMTGKSGTTYLELNGGDTSGEGGLLFADGSGGNYGLVNYSHASDLMQFYTASGERMRITADGTVAIGNPSSVATAAKLQIGDALSPASSAALQVNGFTRIEHGLLIHWDSDNTEAGYLQYSGNNGFSFTTEGAGSGNVGIGTTSPRSITNHTSLTINGTSVGRVDLSYGGTISASLYSNNSATGLQTESALPLVFGTNETERMRIDSSGNVLINATSKYNGYPSTFITQTLASSSGDVCPILELVGNRSANAGNQNAMIQFFNKTSTAVEVGRITSSQGSATNSGQLQFHTANAGTLSERMRIDSSGRVGINVIPSYSNVPLHTKKLGGGDAYNIFEGDNAWVFGEVDYTGTKVCQVAGRYGHHSGINVDTAGQVGIGTVIPTVKLEIYGSFRARGDQNALIELTNTSGNTKAYLGNAGNEGDLGLYTSGNVKTVYLSSYYNSYFNGNGNVGIGTTSPSEIFHVNKNATSRIVGAYLTNSQANTGAEAVSIAFGLNRSGGDFVRQVEAIEFGATEQWTGTPSTVNSYLAFNVVKSETMYERMRVTTDGVDVTSNGAHGVHLKPDTADTNNSGRLMLTRIGGSGWAVMNNSQNFSIRSGAIAGTTSGTEKIRLTGYSATSWTSGSDETMKENIIPIGNVLDKIQNYRCVEYNFIDDEATDKKIGFIAQDWQEDFPQIIEQMENEKIGMKYTETIPILLKAIQELKADNDNLRERIQTLENQ